MMKLIALRTFDPETQRSIDKIEQIRLLPAREFPLTDSAIGLFKRQWRERFDVNVKKCPTYQDVSNGFRTRWHRILPALIF